MTTDGNKFQSGMLSVDVDDLNMGGKKENLKPMWETEMKQVDLEEPKLLKDQVYLGRSQRECKPNQKIVLWNKNVFESLISAGGRDPTLKITAWSYDMEGHAKKCVEKVTANWQTRKSSIFSKSPHRVYMIIISKMKNVKLFGELSEVCSQFVLK